MITQDNKWNIMDLFDYQIWCLNLLPSEKLQIQYVNYGSRVIFLRTEGSQAANSS